MKIPILYLILISISSLIGCATIGKGYEDRVRIQNAPADLRIYTKDSIEIPLSRESIKISKTASHDEFEEKEIVTIRLRSNIDHVLVLKSQGKEKCIQTYARLSPGWVLLDLVTLTFWVDMYTGNWNHFNEIDASF